MEYAYYAKLIKDGFHTQCTLDLESGAVKIQDVPFEFRNTEAYEAAHLYARTIKDEKERHDAYWQIQKQLESDIVQCEAEHQWRNGGKHRHQAIMPRDTSCFVLEERTDALMATYDFLFIINFKPGNPIPLGAERKGSFFTKKIKNLLFFLLSPEKSSILNMTEQKSKKSAERRRANGSKRAKCNDIDKGKIIS